MYPIHMIVDRYHVSTPIDEILGDLRGRIRRARAKGSQISKGKEKAILRAARARHRANIKLYVMVMKGF